MLKEITYKVTGVDIDEADRFVRGIKKMIRSTRRDGVRGDVGGFGGLFALNLNKYQSPLFVSSTDGVGTKLKLAQLANKYDTIGVDLVAMNVNDILCCGAEPLFFLDYLAVGKINRGVMTQMVKGIVRGCRESGCALIGGETAEMPGVYDSEDFDLAGFCVGVVEEAKLVNGSRIAEGDKIIGLESSGLHSNGFSLVRRVFSESELEGLADELLRPTRIYVKPILAMLKEYEAHGLAHITGGAFYDKIGRILPRNRSARIYKQNWNPPAIFRSIQDRANIDDYEMHHTFNMGIGMAVIARAEDVSRIIAMLGRYKCRAWEIGEIVKGRSRAERAGRVEIIG